MTVSQEILNEAFKQYARATNQKKPDIGRLARECDLPYSTVYNPLYNKRPTSAEIFLKILKGLGALEHQKKGVFINSQKINKLAS